MRIIEHNGYKIRAETDAGIYKATVIKDNKELSSSRTTNTTNPKSVILDAIYTLLVKRREEIINEYLNSTRSTRITKKKKEMLFNNDNDLNVLNDLYQYVKKEDL